MHELIIILKRGKPYLEQRLRPNQTSFHTEKFSQCSHTNILRSRQASQMHWDLRLKKVAHDIGLRLMPRKQNA